MVTMLSPQSAESKISCCRDELWQTSEILSESKYPHLPPSGKGIDDAFTHFENDLSGCGRYFTIAITH